ncbi:MAG: radical SAM protein [Thermoplasmatales archaeon]|nr:MAG: radical SAM protein [Thermoplasmatales archaeon]
MKIRQINCKTALSPSFLPGLDYSLNPYRGCEHNCAYCYAPNVLKIKRENWGNFIDVKSNIPLVLSKEVKNKKGGIVGISTVTDPYQPIEKKYKLTLNCLEQLLKYDFPISIQTKSSLVLRDIKMVSKFSNAEVIISITTFDDNERKLLEPYASTVEKRLDALRKYAEVGIQTSVFFGPIYPSISTDEIPEIIDTFIDYGASKIWIDSLNLKQGVWNSIKKNIFSNQEMYKAFSKNIFENKEHYSTLRKEIFTFAQKRNVKIVDAF